MKPKEFVDWAEAVFGKYTPAMKAEVELDLKDRSPYWIDALRLIVLQEHPSIYRVPPGVHEIYAMRLLVHPLSHEIEEKRQTQAIGKSW
jgi:hypothetical protein